MAKSARYEVAIDASAFKLATVEVGCPIRKFSYTTLDQAISVVNIARFLTGHVMIGRESGVPHTLAVHDSVQLGYNGFSLTITRER
jgi:hypothetical protein